MIIIPEVTPEELEELRRPKRSPYSRAHQIIRKGVAPIFREHGKATQGRAYVRLNHGRWIIDCPFCPCAGFAYNSSGAQHDRWKCPPLPYGCENAAAGKRWVEVIWPDEDLMRRVMMLCALRPETARNWRPGEQVSMLERENIDHQLPIEDVAILQQFRNA